MAETDWLKYGWCPVCEQTAGGPCFDLRYGRYNRTFHRATPHKGRLLKEEQ